MQGRLVDLAINYLSGLHHDLALPDARFRRNTDLNVVPSFNHCTSRSASNGREIVVLAVWISKEARLKGTTLIRRQVLLSSSSLLLLRTEKFIPEMSMPHVNLCGHKKKKQASKNNNNSYMCSKFSSGLLYMVTMHVSVLQKSSGLKLSLSPEPEVT